MRFVDVYRSALVASFSCLGGSALAGSVVIVNGSGAPYADIQSAVAAASDGDILLVAPGVYPAFTITDKSLTILKTPGAATATVTGLIQVKNLAPTRSVLIGDLVAFIGVSLSDDAGAVTFEGCTIKGLFGGSAYPVAPNAGPAALVTNSARVNFVSCALSGGIGSGGCGSFPAPIVGGSGGAAIQASGSRIAIQGCQLSGGPGGKGNSNSGSGGAGASFTSGFLFATSSSFQGGDGAFTCNSTSVAGNGGDGLDAGGIAHVSGCSLAGGAGGGGQQGTHGNPGQPSSGSVTVHANVERAMIGPRAGASGSSIVVTLNGAPNDVVYLTSSLSAEWHWTPANNGVWLLPFPPILPIVPSGVVPASGVLTLETPLPELSAGANTGSATVQALVVAGNGARVLSDPVHVAVVRASSRPDCNLNGTNEYLELMSGGVTDCNDNALPDTCESLPGMDQDCNANSVPDYCDLLHTTSVDANANGIPDECDPHTTWYVDASAPAGGNGSQAQPFQTIGDGFAASQNYDTVLVADGTYVGPQNRELDLHGKSVRVLSQHGPASCIIDCQHAGRAFALTGATHGSSLIAGFRIVNGAATTGGGISVDQCSVRIANCIVRQCTAANGGGIYLANTNSIVKYCTIEGNSATGGLATNGIDGGGIMVLQNFGGSLLARAVVSHCRILDNHASHPSAATGGGGIGHYGGLGGHPAGSGLFVDNCLIAGNSSGSSGGGIGSKLSSSEGSALVVTNSTLVGNSSVLGGGVAAYGQHGSALANSILSGNTASTNGPQLFVYFNYATDSMRVSFCDVRGGLNDVSVGGAGSGFTWAGGNIDLDPQFVDPNGPDGDPLTVQDNDYRLRLSSPCVDAGDNLQVPHDLADIDDDGNTSELVPRDLDLDSRFHDALADPDTGDGIAPVVDMGCFEIQSG